MRGGAASSSAPRKVSLQPARGGSVNTCLLYTSQPLQQRVVVVAAREGMARQEIDLRRREAEAQGVKQEEIVQLVGAHQLLSLIHI